MGYGTVRISDQAHETLREMARAEGRPMLALLDEAVEALRRRRFLEQVNAAYSELRSDARRWQAVQDERNEWDATLADGLHAAEGRGRYGADRANRKGRKRR